MNISLHRFSLVKSLAGAALCLTILAGCTTPGGHAETPAADAPGGSGNPLPVVRRAGSSAEEIPLDTLIGAMADKRVVFIGETHNRFEHHLTQLEIIRRLHQIHPDLAIGVEFFQQPYQQALDGYIAGRIDEAGMLKATEYYSRWKFDYRLYRPILQYAREHRIPVIALNVPGEVSEQVARHGLAGVPDDAQRWIPAQIDRSGAGYRKRLHEIFEQHPHAGEQDFERFYEAQLLWDEAMAQRAARYLRSHPDTTLVVLAGSGHLIYGDGIPDRLRRRQDVDLAILLIGDYGDTDPEAADFLLAPPEIQLPPRGMLGIYMEDTDRGVRIRDFAERSAARDAGMRKGDTIVSIDGTPVDSSEDILITLVNATPGQRVEVGIARDQLPDPMRFRLELL